MRRRTDLFGRPTFLLTNTGNFTHTSVPHLADNKPATTTSPFPLSAFSNRTYAAHVGQESKRVSTSPATSNKALPQLPSISNTGMDSMSGTSPEQRQLPNESQTAPTFPASASFASTVYARARSSQDGTPTPKPPGTPQAYPHASPIVTAATPEQPQHPDPSATPLARSTVHQRSRSHSSDVLAWDRPQSKAARPVSSADAYMKPIETLQSEASSRPGTALSHLSGSNWMHDGPSNRSSVGTTSTTPMSQMKRASVLSFQTANSAGFTSGDEARASDREDIADDTFIARPPGGISIPSSLPNQTRPWLDRGYSGYGSSPDERPLPGGLPGSFWADAAAQSSVRTAAAPALRQELHSTPTSGAAADAEPALPSASKSGATTQVEQADFSGKESAKDVVFQDAHSVAPTNIGSSLTPINTQGLAPASPNAPLSSTTIAALSDETTQAVRRSPDAMRGRQAPFPLLDTDAPPPPAKDVQPDATVARHAASSSPRGGTNAEFGADINPPSADNVIPPSLPCEAVKMQSSLAPDMLLNGPADHKPVSDYRKKPLADISPAQKAAGLAHLQAQARAAKQVNMEMQHPPPTAPPAEAPPIPILERGRRKSNASLTANVALAQAAVPGLPSADLVARPDTPSAESVSAESSAPPDGEVEARAEWERRRMKRKNGNKQKEAVKTQKGRPDPFKGQLKPLQLVPADNLSTFTDRNGFSGSAYNTAMRANGDRNSVAFGDRAANALAPVGGDAPAPRQTYSTQQLQKLQAREQRRSVGAFSAAMAAANVVSSGSDGPYPVFASPNSGPQKVGSRQYPGLMAQRSLVPPFELQHRPDGLPSGLIGPDGVRRSLNDPEVCLECMMRDEDMIDIRVVGEGVWERESDKEFEEALRLEAEEAANGNGTHGPSGSSGHGDSISSHRDSRGSRKLRKRIGKGEPLTVDRLKLHTQMNPPASSFRWRTLQTFLAVQAKYIAMEQQRMRLEADKKNRQNTDSISSRGSIVGFGSPALTQPSERGLSSPFAPTREGPAASRPSTIQNSVEDSGLTLQQKQEKERDIAAAQAARRKMTASATAQAASPPLGPAYPTTPLQTRNPSQALSSRIGTDTEELLAGPAAKGGVLSTPSGSRRVPFGSAQAGRAASVQDLRSAADVSRSSSTVYPSSPSDNLMPPSRLLMGTSPTGTPSRLGARSGASQLSLMHSGSMIDMHVAQEDRAEHRINQTGFVPGTPLAVESPAALNRSFYGFPGDGDSSLSDAAAFERSRMVSGDGYMDPMEAGPRGLELARDDSSKRKKKGFRGLLSKLTGSSGGLSRENSNGPAGESISGSIASRNPSKRSQGSGSPRLRQNSFSADRSLDATSPALNGMLSKARRSTSSFFRNGVEPDPDSRARAPVGIHSNSMFQNPPGMASQNSLDLGPFQPASPSLNTFGSTNSRIQQQQQPGATSDAARMRKASNPLMQKYLNSPSPQTQAPSVPNAGSMSQSSFGMDGERLPVQNGRMSSFASMRDLRPSPLQTIPDGDQRVDEDDPRKSMRSSGASIRKDLPFMPSASGGVRNGGEDAASGAPERAVEQQRPASNGTGGVQSATVDSTDSVTRSSGLAPAIAAARPGAGDFEGRMSMQTSRGTSGFGGRQALPAINTDTGFGLHPDDASVSSANPRRPPKNPRRPEGVLNSPSVVDFNVGNDTADPTTPRRDFPQQHDGYNDDLFGSAESPDKGRKSRFRLPFGRKKRESTLAESKPTIVVGGGDGMDSTPEARSTSRTFLPGLRTRKSYAGLGVPKASFQMERQRVLSSPAHEGSSGHPPRSQSAFGMAPTQRFVSMDVPRRSMNIFRGGNNRLSAMNYGVDDEEDEDDEMEREPGYEAEFNRYAQEAMEERYLNTGPKGRDVSFGRKSLNLLRDGFKLPLRTVSGDQRKQR